MIRLDSVSKTFDSKIVIRDFSLELKEGEIFVLLGRSGCGKTTLLRMIAGFEKLDRGRIMIGEQNIDSLPVEKRPVGMIFQRHALFPHMTVFDNVAVGPRVRGLSELEVIRRTEETLRVTRLTDLQSAYPARLSGGESQRVAIARAIINRPQILLLDEPLSALDPNLRQSLREELVEMQKAFGITFLFVTHDQEEAMSLAHRIGLLEEGRLIQTDTPTRLYDHPESPFAARFLGDTNRLSGFVDGAEARGLRVNLPGLGILLVAYSGKFLLEQKVVCFIRPEKMKLRGTEPPEADFISFKCVVKHRAFFGNHTKYRVELPTKEILHVLEPHGDQKRDENFQIEDQAWVGFHGEDIHLFPDND